MSKTESSIKTFIRIRPPASNCIFRDPTDDGTLNCCERLYRFSHVFAAEASDEEIFERIGFQLVENTLNGLNSTLFAYGQTGTGKTYTMTGNSLRGGLVQRCVGLLIRRLAHCPRLEGYSLRMNYVEIYNEAIRDLLAEREGRIVVRELARSGFYVEGLEAAEVGDEEGFGRELQRGLLKRSTKSTKMNEVSSRSHTILTLFLEAKVADEQGGSVLRVSKLNFVDLAGSEKQKQTDVTGSKLKEASNINKSLTTLSLVISKLAEKAKGAHVPYRESVLTKLLKDSIGGNSMTTFIGTVSAQKTWLSETLSTLLFLDRLKNVRNVVEVNEKVQGKEQDLLRKISKQQERISDLEQQLADVAKREEDGRTRVETLQRQLEEAQIQVRELEERLLDNGALNGFFSFAQNYVEQQQPSYFQEASQEIDFMPEGEEKLSTVHELANESEDVGKQRFQTEVKSSRPQCDFEERRSTASPKERRSVRSRGEGKSLWQMEAEFLREELGKYGEDDEAYSDFVRLISENMANFQFAAAQILIMKAQAERLKRTESHLDAYRAKFAELAALAEKEKVQIRSQMLEVRSLEIDSISRKSVLLSSQQQLQQQLEALRASQEEVGIRAVALQDAHRIQIFRLQEKIFAVEQENRKASDQLLLLKDENSKLSEIIQFYREEAISSTQEVSESESSGQESSGRECEFLKQKVKDLQDLIENDFLQSIQELELRLKTKTEAHTQLSCENQALRENICTLEETLAELRMRSEPFYCLDGIPTSLQQLSDMYEALREQNQEMGRKLEESRLETAALGEQLRLQGQRLRNEEQAHRQAQTFFRYQLKVKRAELSKMKEQRGQLQQAQAGTEMHHTQQVSQLTASLNQLETQLQQAETQKQQAEAQKQQAEKARQVLIEQKRQLQDRLRVEECNYTECLKCLMKANELYRSEQFCFYRYKDQYRRQLQDLREENRQLLRKLSACAS